MKGKTLTYIFILTCILSIKRMAAQQTEFSFSNLQTGQMRFSNMIADTAVISELIRWSEQNVYQSNEDAQRKLGRALEMSRRSGYKDGIAMALLGMGTCYFEKGNYGKSIDYFKQALPYCNEARFYKKKLFVVFLGNMAAAYTYQSKNDTAICYELMALELAKLINDTSLQIQVYSNIGAFWLFNRKYNYALDYLARAESLARSFKDFRFMGRIYLNMGYAYGALGKNREQFIYIKKSLEWGEKNQGDVNPAALGNLADYYLKVNRPDSAVYYANRLLRGLQNDNNDYYRLTPYLILANASFDLKKYGIAREYALTGLQIAKRSDVNTEILTKLNASLADINFALGRHTEAYGYLETYARLNDSLQNAERNKSIDLIEAKYRASQKDKEIVQQNLTIIAKEGQIQRKNIWIAVISGGLILLAMLLIVASKNHTQKQKLQAERMRTLEQEQEIGNLKYMMKGEEKERSRLARDIHDGIIVLFSGIKIKLRALPANCESLDGTEDYKDLLTQMDHAIRELRRTAHNLMPDMLLQGGLVEAVFYFCRNLQENTGLEIEFQQYGEIPQLQEEFELSIYRIIQELVQNIVKHAKASKALIQFSYHERMLNITVEDDGIGFDVGNAERTTGMGLKSIRTRMRALNGTMEITSDSTATTVYLEIDIRSHTNKRLNNYAY